MKTLKLILILSCICLVTSCRKDSLVPPKLEFGLATLEICLSQEMKDANNESVLQMIVSNPILEYKTIDIPVSTDGNYYASIPVFGIGTGTIRSELIDGNISLMPNATTKVNIYYNGNGTKVIDLDKGITPSLQNLFTVNHIVNEVIIDNMDGHITNGYSCNFSIAPDEFIVCQKGYLDIIAKYINQSDTVSKLAKELSHYTLIPFLADMSFLSYSNTKLEADSLAMCTFHPQAFEALDLGNIKNVYSSYYQPMMQQLLSNNYLKISPIADSKIASWIGKTKKILGYDTNNTFYNLLAANSYSKQLSEGILLTEQQTQNIKDGFETSYARVLFGANDELRKVMEHNKTQQTLHINKQPIVSKEVMLKTIVDKYKGTIVLVDFWATWCGPCLQAMKESASIKNNYVDDVVFVYITSTSSPKGTWEQMLSDINGEHYYLDEESWEYIIDSLEFTGIPAYFIYDQEGEFKYKSIGYMGNEKLKEWLDELKK